MSQTLRTEQTNWKKKENVWEALYIIQIRQKGKHFFLTKQSHTQRTAWAWEYEVWKDFCKFCKAHSFLLIIRGSAFTPRHLSAAEEVMCQRWQEGNGVKKCPWKQPQYFLLSTTSHGMKLGKRNSRKLWSPVYLNSQQVTLEKQLGARPLGLL